MAKPAPKTGDASMVGPQLSGSASDADAREAYEDDKLQRLAQLSTEIKDLRSKIQTLPVAVRESSIKRLRTASGNGVVALTKLQHLAASPPESWLRFKPAVERAFVELENAVGRTRETLAH